MIDEGKPRAFCFSLTPFDDKNRLDEETLRAHLRRVSAAGLGVYMGGSGGGEAYALTPSEMFRVMQIGVEELRGKVPVWSGSFETRNADTMYEHAESAIKAGVEAIQIYPIEGGHGMVPTPRELEAYYDELISEIDCPVVLTDHHKLGYTLSIDLVNRLIDRYYDKIIAVNFCQANPNYLIDMHDTYGHKVKIYSGGVQFGITNLGFGGWGFNSSESQVMPYTAMAVVESFKSGDVATAVQAHSYMLRLTRLFQYLLPATPRPMKTILQLLGLPAGNLRRPYLAPTVEELEKTRRALEQFDILGIEKQFGA